MKFKEFDKPEYFVNRELSWIKFDDRVLSEARDKNLPLFERLKFLSITSSNLDEFYMVRVASLKDQVHAGYKKTDIAGMTAKEQLKAISRQTHDLVHVQYSILNRSLVPALEKAGLHVIFEHEAFSEKQKEFVDQYFEDNRAIFFGEKSKAKKTITFASSVNTTKRDSILKIFFIDTKYCFLS